MRTLTTTAIFTLALVGCHAAAHAASCAKLMKHHDQYDVFTGSASYFYYCSDEGDYIGTGTTPQRVLFTVVGENDAIHVVRPGVEGEPAGAIRGVTSDDAQFRASLRELRDQKSISLEVDAGNDGDWRLEFAPPVESTLGVGTFRRAERLSSRPSTRPGMDVSGNHRGCNRIWGSFEIHELKRAGDELQSVEISFVQRCRTPDGPAMHGRIRYRNPDFEDGARARAQDVVSVNPGSLVGRWFYANGSGEGYILAKGGHISLSLHHRPSNRFFHFLGQQIGSSISGQWVAVGEPGEAGTAILEIQKSGQRLEVTQTTGGEGWGSQAFIKIR